MQFWNCWWLHGGPHWTTEASKLGTVACTGMGTCLYTLTVVYNGKIYEHNRFLVVKHIYILIWTFICWSQPGSSYQSCDHESGMHKTIHANVSKCLLIFQHRTGNDTTVWVYMHLLKEELNGWTHPLSLSFWRLWFIWKTFTSAHTPLAEILLFLRLQKVRQHKRELFKFHCQCIIYLAKLTLCQKGSGLLVRS